MKIDKNEAFGVCIMSLYGITLAARAILGDVHSHPAASTRDYLSRAIVPIESQSPIKSPPVDNTGLAFEQYLIQPTLTKVHTNPHASGATLERYFSPAQPNP